MKLKSILILVLGALILMASVPASASTTLASAKSHVNSGPSFGWDTDVPTTQYFDIGSSDIVTWNNQWTNNGVPFSYYIGHKFEGSSSGQVVQTYSGQYVRLGSGQSWTSGSSTWGYENNELRRQHAYGTDSNPFDEALTSTIYSVFY